MAIALLCATSCGVPASQLERRDPASPRHQSEVHAGRAAPRLDRVGGTGSVALSKLEATSLVPAGRDLLFAGRHEDAGHGLYRVHLRGGQRTP